MQRIYLPDTNIFEKEIIISDPNLLHQLTKVLRIKNGFQLAIFDGNQAVNRVFEVINIEKKSIHLSFLYQQENNAEIDFQLCLYNALPNKLEKIEYIIQKGTEIWFTSFVFFRSERSQKLILWENKIQRLKKIIAEAAEQSGRAILPELDIREKFDFHTLPEGKNIFFHTQNEKSSDLKSIEMSPGDKINLFVWPEWGWSDSEVEILEINTSRIHLWNRILRTETTWITTGFFLIHK